MSKSKSERRLENASSGFDKNKSNASPSPCIATRRRYITLIYGRNFSKPGKRNSPKH